MKTLPTFLVLFLLAGSLFLNACQELSLKVPPEPQPQPPLYSPFDETAPLLQDIVPQKGTIGSLVRLYGQRFSPNAAENRIWFGSVNATSVEIVNSGELIVEVPANARTGRVHIEVHGKSCTGPFFIIPAFDEDMQPLK